MAAAESARPRLNLEQTEQLAQLITRTITAVREDATARSLPYLDPEYTQRHRAETAAEAAEAQSELWRRFYGEFGTTWQVS